MNARTWVLIAVISLFLYWVVQAPLTAADTLRTILDWTGEMLGLIASRLLEFLDALL